MKKLLFIPLVFLLCLAFGCQKGEEVAEEPVVDVEADIALIKKIVDEWNAANNAGDIDKLVSFFTDDAVRIPANEPALIGKEAIRDWLQQSFDQFTVESESRFVDAKVSGDLAFFRGTWTSLNTPKDGGKPLNLNGNFVSIIQKRLDGSWKTVFNSWSNEQLILPPPEKE